MSPVSWIELDDKYRPIESALILLKRSFEDEQYGHLSEKILQDKIVSGVLRLWSYGADKLDPDASAFFFLRRKHKVSGQSKPQAYCLTVGAKPYVAGSPPVGLSATDLRTQLGVVCQSMRSGGVLLEVMHARLRPNFREPTGNLATVYTQAVDPAATPPQLQTRGSIEVEDSWADAPTQMKWWNIKET